MADYVQETSPISPSYSEESSIADYRLSLDELLDKVHIGADSQPTVSSRWNDDCNDKNIQKCFKMRRRVVDTDEFIARYMFAGDLEGYKNMKMQWATQITPIEDFLERSTCCIDSTESALFLPSKSTHRAWFCKDIEYQASSDGPLEELHKSLLEAGVDFGRFSILARELMAKVRLWLKKVALTVSSPVKDTWEPAYEKLFLMYLQVFNLECLNGSSVKLSIPYRNRKVSSVPDILFGKEDRKKQNFFGAVEVKRMILDPILKHAFADPPGKGILHKSNDGRNPPKKRKVAIDLPPGEASGPNAREESEEKDIIATEESEAKEISAAEESEEKEVDGAPLTNAQQEFIKLFFGQLFGSVLALDCCDPPAMDLPRQRLGIGVVGFRVVFFLFYSRPAMPFKDVPCVDSNRMDVVMTSVLSLLKASDRKQINEILLALSANVPPLPEDE